MPSGLVRCVGCLEAGFKRLRSLLVGFGFVAIGFGVGVMLRGFKPFGLLIVAFSFAASIVLACPARALALRRLPVAVARRTPLAVAPVEANLPALSRVYFRSLPAADGLLLPVLAFDLRAARAIWVWSYIPNSNCAARDCYQLQSCASLAAVLTAPSAMARLPLSLACC